MEFKIQFGSDSDVINLLQKSLLGVERMEEFCAKLFLFHFHQGTDVI